MSKTWETLFNLSSFMKYLLTEVLPDEKVEAPTYVLESLYELLTVTVDCFDTIKNGPNKNRIKSQVRERSLEDILSSRTNVTNINLKDGKLSNKNILSPGLSSAEDLGADSGTVSDKKCSPKLLSKEFIKLSEEMMIGRPFGYYCRPCDSTVLSKKLWDEHNSDKLHNFLKENCEIKHSSCSYCNLIIFASFDEAKYLFDYHQKQHFLSQNSSSISAINVNEVDAINTLEKSESSENKLTISPEFVELDKQMHCGKERGFFCHICDKAYDAVAKWNEHFRKEEVHNPIDNNETFEMCGSCKLVIFATPAMQEVYKTYHMLGHHIRDNNKNEDHRKSYRRKGSTENLVSYKKKGSTENLANQNRNERIISREGKASNFRANNYIIADQFKSFCDKIHDQNLQGCFYCRPCNACLNMEEWEKHSNERKHSDLMYSRKYKNYIGKCTYCSLTIVGTRETVKFYMDYHNKYHGNILSYHEERVVPNYSQFSRRGNRGGNRGRGKRAPSASNSVSTVGGEEEEESSSDDDENATAESENASLCGSETNIGNKSEKDPICSNNIAESSWYTSSRDEKIHFMVFKLVNSRLEQKKNGGLAEFGALCMVCEEISESAFDWQDHVSSESHSKSISTRDRLAKINDLNILLLGDKDVLEKYKTLVSGNMTII